MASVYDTIVVGTVRSLGQPRRYDTPYVQIVLTPAVAEVERALHGNIGEGNLHVEVSTFDGACPRVYYVEAPSVEAGGRYVLFIYRSGSNVRGLSDVPIVTAAWPIDADDVITTAIDGPMTLKAFIALLPKPRTSPSGGPATPP